MELPTAEVQAESRNNILDLPNELLVMTGEACFFSVAISLRPSCRKISNALFDPRARLRPRNRNMSAYFERLRMDDEQEWSLRQSRL